MRGRQWRRNAGPTTATLIRSVDWRGSTRLNSAVFIEPRRDLFRALLPSVSTAYCIEVYQIPRAVRGCDGKSHQNSPFAGWKLSRQRRAWDKPVSVRSPDGMKLELRVATIARRHRRKVVMRIFGPEVLLAASADLGFSDDDRRAGNQTVARPRGIILVTGPRPDSNRTTLLLDLAKRWLATRGSATSAPWGGPDRDGRGRCSNQAMVRPQIGVDFRGSGAHADAPDRLHHHGRQSATSLPPKWPCETEDRCSTTTPMMRNRDHAALIDLGVPPYHQSIPRSASW